MPSDKEAEETAWRIHSALAEWTGKVDAKATFALTIESAILAGVVTLAGPGHHLHGMHGAKVLIPFWIGVSCVLAGIVLAAWTVMPTIRRARVNDEWESNIIFFGHLRHWTSSNLERRLRENDVLPVLSRQLVNMSRIAWNKHLRVQWAMTGGLLGTAAIAAAYFLV